MLLHVDSPWNLAIVVISSFLSSPKVQLARVAAAQRQAKMLASPMITCSIPHLVRLLSGLPVECWSVGSWKERIPGGVLEGGILERGNTRWSAGGWDLAGERKR